MAYQGPDGGMKQLWVQNLEITQSFIKEYKLKSVSRKTLGTEVFQLSPGMMSGGLKEASLKFRWPPFPGGIRIPHLHFKGELYLLTEEQWKSYTTTVMEGFKAKLDKVNTINFNQMLNLSDAIDSL